MRRHGWKLAAAVLAVAIGLSAPQSAQAANACKNYPVLINNPDTGEGGQVAILSLCPERLVLDDLADIQPEPRGVFFYSPQDGELSEVFAQTTNLSNGRYYVEARFAGLNQLRCFFHQPGKRWLEMEVPEGESGFHCYELTE